MVFGSSPALAPNSRPSENDAIILHWMVGKVSMKWGIVLVVNIQDTITKPFPALVNTTQKITTSQSSKIEGPTLFLTIEVQ